MADNTVDVDLTEKLLGAPDEAATGDKARLWRAALRLLANGEPVTLERLAAAADFSVTDLEDSPAGQDIEYDEQRRIIGWGLTLNPTPHQFTVNDHQLYTWCAPDTLIFPAVIGATATVESHCPATGTTIRLTVDPTTGVTSLDPATTVVSIVDPAQVDTRAVRATGCNLQHFFASAGAAREYQSRHPGMKVLPVNDAYQQIIQPMADAMLKGDTRRGCC